MIATVRIRFASFIDRVRSVHFVTLARLGPLAEGFGPALHPSALLAAGAVLSLLASAAHAQPGISVRVDTPEFGIRIGQPLPRFGAPVIFAPAPVVVLPPQVSPQIVYSPVFFPPVAYPPVIFRPVPAPVFYGPPRFVFPPVVIATPRFGRPVPRGHAYGRSKHRERDEGRVMYAPF